MLIAKDLNTNVSRSSLFKIQNYIRSKKASQLNATSYICIKLHVYLNILRDKRMFLIILVVINL